MPSHVAPSALVVAGGVVLASPAFSRRERIPEPGRMEWLPAEGERASQLS